MSTTAIDDQIQTLLGAVDDLVRADKLQQAATTLKEATNLQPHNEAVKERWLTLQRREPGGDTVSLIRSFVATGSQSDGQHALQSIRQRQLSSQATREVMDLLDKANALSKLSDELTGALLVRQVEARKLMAHDLVANATAVFASLFPRGDETFRALTYIPFDDGLWTDKQTQRMAQKDVFRWCEATLMDAAVEHPERAMQAIARGLATAPENVASLIDDDAFDVVLSALDIRLNVALRSQATLATAKMLEATKEKGASLFASFVATRVGRQTNDDLIVAFSAAAAIFPVIPTVASQLFLTEGFVRELVPNLERNSAAAATGKRKSRTLEQAALELLSAACVEKNCREAINKHCSPWLKTTLEERQGQHQALAALILAKVGASTDVDVSQRLCELVLHADHESDQAIEGLAYTTLQPKVKEAVANNQALLESVVTALKERSSATFGSLTVVSNLVAYRIHLSEEQKKMTQLKAYANQSKPAPDDPLDNNGFVTSRCKKVLDQDVVPAMLVACKQTTSPTTIALVVGILLALAKEQKHRAKMTQQGAVKLLLQIRERITKSNKVTSEASLVERNAAHALARLLISVNPAHVFSAGFPASTAVGALVPLLSADHDSEQRDLLPTFEALLALTNLASMEDDTIRDLQLRTAWEKIEELLFSSNTLVQRASVELVCNLMSSPSCVALFADSSKDAQRRITLLLALADVDDLATRRAAGGALAMLTEWDAAVIAVLEAKNGQGVDILLSMCEDEQDEMKHRGLVCLSNVVGAPAKVGEDGVKILKNGRAIDVIKEALKETRDPEILRLGVLVLKKLV